MFLFLCSKYGTSPGAQSLAAWCEVAGCGVPVVLVKNRAGTVGLEVVARSRLPN